MCQKMSLKVNIVCVCISKCVLDKKKNVNKQLQRSKKEHQSYRSQVIIRTWRKIII